MYTRKLSKSFLRRSGVHISGPCTVFVDLSRMNAYVEPHIALVFDIDGAARVSPGRDWPSEVLEGWSMTREHLARTAFELTGAGTIWVDLNRANAVEKPIVAVWFELEREEDRARAVPAPASFRGSVR